MTDLDERIIMLAEWMAQLKRLVVFTSAYDVIIGKTVKIA
jgi:hypothetical protein